MAKQHVDADVRLEQQYRRLRTRNPVCVSCSEADPFCLELHHLAGQKHHDDVGIICRNCHRKLTNQQHDHTPSSVPETRGPMATIAHYLLGLADLLLMIVTALRDFGRQLMERAYGTA